MCPQPWRGHGVAGHRGGNIQAHAVIPLHECLQMLPMLSYGLNFSIVGCGSRVNIPTWGDNSAADRQLLRPPTFFHLTVM
jgi:hypothetical protein